jgi:hypothetical protein
MPRGAEGLLIAGVLLLGGCMTVESRCYSRPEVAGGLYYREVHGPNGQRREPVNGGKTVRVVVEGMRISLTSGNETADVFLAGPIYLPIIPWSGCFTVFTEPDAPVPFEVRIEFEAQEGGAAAWAFDARQARLAVDGGTWLGPVECHRSGGHLDGRAPGADSVLIFDDAAMIYVGFDAPGSARSTFHIQLSGLTRNGIPVDVPPFTLRRETDFGFYAYPGDEIVF